MPGDPEFIKVLENKVKEYRAELAKLEREMASLAQKRADFEEALKNASGLLKRETEHVHPEVKPPQRRSEGLEGLGMRDAVLKVVSESKGIGPSDVATELEKRGFKYEGTTDLAHRVNNELLRLLKQGRVERVGRGAYKAVPSESGMFEDLL